MINSDLILAPDGGVIYVQDQPFDRTIVRAEFYIETGYLILVYDDEDSRMVECEILGEKVVEAISHVPTLILTHVKNEKMQDGFEVPLIAVRP